MKRFVALLFIFIVSVHPVVSAQFRPSRPVPDHWLIAHGDSITGGIAVLGQDYDLIDAWPNQVITAVTSAKGYIFGGANLAISGTGFNTYSTQYQTFDGWRENALGNLTTDAVNRVDALHTLPNAKLVILAGTNDIFVNGTTGAATFTLLQTYINARISAGWSAGSICVCTCLPRTGLNETQRTAYNSAINSNAGSMGYVVADLAANATIGAAGANTNTTYYVDGTHPTTAGHAIIAGIVQGVLYP